MATKAAAGGKGQLKRRRTHHTQQIDRNWKGAMNTDASANQERLPSLPEESESVCNGKGSSERSADGMSYIDINSHPIDEEITGAIRSSSSTCPANGNADVLADNGGTHVAVINHPKDKLILPVDFHVQQDVFKKTSSMWQLIEGMQVFRKFPQRPHFLSLQQFLPALREGMAIGLMVTYANLVEGVKNSSMSDSIASFEEKMSTLAHLEENGFDVDFFQHSLNKMLHTKSDYGKHLRDRDKLKELILGNESAVSRIHALLNEKEKAISLQEQKLERLHREAEQIVKEIEDENAELLQLKKADSIVQEACGAVEGHFRSILAELH